MSRENPHDGKPVSPRNVVPLAEARERRLAAKEDTIAPIRDAFMSELGELLADYLEAIDDATNGDPDKAVEELMASCATLVALAAEEHFDGIDEQIEFIDAVAEVAADIVGDDDAQGELFEDDDR